MLCQNCHEHEANVHYTQTINGVKKEMVLCEECARKLGIGNISFSMPMSLSSIFGDFLEDYEQESLLPSFVKPSELQCNQCGMTYQEFINGGKFGCEHCYDVFADQIDPILKNIQGAITKDLLIRKEDIQVIHGFDSVANAENYLLSDLFKNDVYIELKALWQTDPEVKIYTVA